MSRVYAGTGGYVRRVIDDELDELFVDLPAISLDGPKGVGKTRTANERAATRIDLDDPVVVELIRADPLRLANSPEPIVIDEWQRLPFVWDVVRRAVDDDPRPGRFILTGSASPNEAPMHSGAGRIVPMRMRPLTLLERGVGVPTVSMSQLLTGERAPLYGSTDVRLADYVREIVTSGLPAIRRAGKRAQRRLLDGYVQLAIDRDVVEAGHDVRNPVALRRWMTAYAAATSTTASFETIRDASTAGEGAKPARSTVAPYRDALERIWLLDPIAGWVPTFNHLRRLTEAPKHHLADPALAASLLGATEATLLTGVETGPAVVRDGTLLGGLFESLIALSVRVFAQANDARVFHLRTKGGEHEIDFIVEAADGRVLAIEVKLDQVAQDKDVRHLQWLQEQFGDRVLDSAVITTGTHAYRRADGIAVIPAALLGP
jgi:uncharacterized protein